MVHEKENELTRVAIERDQYKSQIDNLRESKPVGESDENSDEFYSSVHLGTVESVQSMQLPDDIR